MMPMCTTALAILVAGAGLVAAQDLEIDEVSSPAGPDEAIGIRLSTKVKQAVFYIEGANGRKVSVPARNWSEDNRVVLEIPADLVGPYTLTVTDGTRTSAGRTLSLPPEKPSQASEIKIAQVPNGKATCSVLITVSGAEMGKEVEVFCLAPGGRIGESAWKRLALVDGQGNSAMIQVHSPGGQPARIFVRHPWSGTSKGEVVADFFQTAPFQDDPAFRSVTELMARSLSVRPFAGLLTTYQDSSHSLVEESFTVGIPSFPITVDSLEEDDNAWGAAIALDLNAVTPFLEYDLSHFVVDGTFDDGTFIEILHGKGRITRGALGFMIPVLDWGGRVATLRLHAGLAASHTILRWEEVSPLYVVKEVQKVNGLQIRIPLALEIRVSESIKISPALEGIHQIGDLSRTDIRGVVGIEFGF